MGLAGEAIAAAQVLGDQGIAEVDNLRLNGAGPTAGGPLLGGVEEPTAEAFVLEVGVDGEGSEIPDDGGDGFEENAALDGGVGLFGGVLGGLFENQEYGVGTGGQLFLEGGFAGAVAVQVGDLSVPAGVRAEAAVGDVHELDDGGQVGW